MTRLRHWSTLILVGTAVIFVTVVLSLEVAAFVLFRIVGAVFDGFRL